MGPEVVRRQRAARRVHERRQALCRRTFVERRRSALGDRPQGGGQGRVAKQGAHGRSAAAGQVERHAGLVERRSLCLEVGSQAGGHGEAVLGVADRGGQEFVQGKAPEARVRVRPRRDRARHRHRHRSRLGDRVVAPIPEERRLGQRASAPAAVEGVDFAGRAVVEEGEGVSAHAVHVRPDDRQHAGHGEGRVGGVAAPAQHVDPRDGGQRVARRHGALGSTHVGAVGRRKHGRRGFGCVAVGCVGVGRARAVRRRRAAARGDDDGNAHGEAGGKGSNGGSHGLGFSNRGCRPGANGPTLGTSERSSLGQGPAASRPTLATGPPTPAASRATSATGRPLPPTKPRRKRIARLTTGAGGG